MDVPSVSEQYDRMNVRTSVMEKSEMTNVYQKGNER